MNLASVTRLVLQREIRVVKTMPTSLAPSQGGDQPSPIVFGIHEKVHPDIFEASFLIGSARKPKQDDLILTPYDETVHSKT